jgi:MFS family permease
MGHMLELYASWIWLPTFIAASLAAHGDTFASSGGWASAMSFVVLAAGAVGCVVGGELADRVGPSRLVVIAMAMSGACALLTPLVFGTSMSILVPLLLVWSVSVIADSAQFSTLVTRVVDPDAVGTALTLQTSIGFLITTVTIQTVPLIAASLGWRWAFPILAVGPALGIGAMRRLRS